MGSQDRSPTSAEMAQMIALLHDALDAGAFGMSTGLIYPPEMSRIRKSSRCSPPTSSLRRPHHCEVALDLRCDPVRALVHVLLEEKLNAWMVVFMMDQNDIERILSDPFTSVGTDGAPAGTGGNPHPRRFGTFPRMLGRCVRERGVLPLEEAIRRMTSLPADTFGIGGRGRIVAGSVADIVVFDALTVADDCNYLDSVRPPHGIRTVVQGGTTVVVDGWFVGRRHGRRLRPERPM